VAKGAGEEGVFTLGAHVSPRDGEVIRHPSGLVVTLCRALLVLGMEPPPEDGGVEADDAVDELFVGDEGANAKSRRGD